ncbi:mucin-2-like [Amyelois transitella]|uniref:mucin-2-like n=1 Tax=Amyelois transitella TaxID=680683 RepID=UPI002990584B|nr:mucin-2-like [Amyelois transitella]
MNGSRRWLMLTLQALLLATSSGKHHPHRRSMPTQATIPVSKSGWRPVIGSGGVLYGTFAGAHQNPSYKIPVPVLDFYPSSSRPLVARDATKLTSIAQSYRPTTLRTVSAAPPAPPANQPINSYHNPFALPNNGFTYKYIQNFPLDSVLIRNPQNPYAARPVFSKYPAKIKQPYHNTVLQQLTNIQPIHFGQYQTSKPLDVFGKPVEGYARPTEPSKQSHGTEIFKPEVYKLPDSDTASQSLTQQVKTAQQSFVVTPKAPAYSHYAFQDAFPPSILGTFGSFGVQSVKARDPVFPNTKTTYLPPQPTKQTIFNSFSFSPSYKPTVGVLSSTTPKLQTTLNQLNFAFNDYKTPTQQTKVSATPAKIDPNAPTKGSFKPSPQDPFIKHFQAGYNKVAVTTYNPIQATTLAGNYYDFAFPSQQSAPVQNQNFNTYENKKQKIHDSFAAGGNQVVNQVPQHFTNPPKQDINSVSSRPTYEVIETTDSGDDIVTHSSPPAWTYQSYDNLKSTEQSVTKHYIDSIFGQPTTTTVPELPEEYAIVTEADKGYENSLIYDGHVESQSRRPLGDDFEPIGKHKLKDYYYKVSTATYEDHTRRTKKPTDAPKIEVTTTHFDITHDKNNENPTEALPTLPPNKHFRRPSSQEPLDKDKIRKRNKNRRRRPPLANINNTSSTTRKYYQTTTEAPLLQTTEPEESHTFKPRVRPFKLKGQPNLTTPSITTDLTTSALPTISPTNPTLVKKKLVRRPLTTTTERLETTTQIYRDSETSNDSPIMKIANRPTYSKLSQSYEYKSSETPDYTHKQDEKDTPTSDIAVNLSETTARNEADQATAFAFHKDVKPIEAKLETTTDSAKGTEAPSEVTSNRGETPGRIQRPRLKNKFNRPKFSVKDYRNRLNSTTSTTEKTESSTKLRFPQRRVPGTESYFNTDVEVTTERRKFMPKDPRHKSGNYSENNEQVEKEIHSIRPQRNRQTAEPTEAVTQKISSRIRNSQRRTKPTEETESNPTTVHSKRPLRKKIKDSSGEETQDVPVTETTVHYDHKNDYTSERTRSESAIMKIADKKHQDHHLEHIFEHSKRVSDLTLAASKDYNTPGMFKTVSSNSRRIPNYFTIATDDPILPIEAFFPQLNQKKES